MHPVSKTEGIVTHTVIVYGINKDNDDFVMTFNTNTTEEKSRVYMF
jgi:hypothetical protein